jgi:predicted nucleic acid-binding protein
MADTGFWIALADLRDKHHKVADDFARNMSEGLIITFPVMTEVCHVLLKRQGVEAQLRFVNMYRLGAFDVFEGSSQGARGNAYGVICRFAHGFCGCFLGFAG